MSWPTVKLGDVCEIVMGQAPAGETYNNDNKGFPLIAGAGDFKNGIIDVKKFTTTPTKLSKIDDIVLSIRASIGDKVWSNSIYCLGRGVAALRVSDDLEKDYLWHTLSHVEKKLASKAKGATFKQVNREDIHTLKIPLPPLAEQKRIAAILDNADEIKRKREQVIAKLDQLAQSIFVEMFGDPSTNDMHWSKATLSDFILSASDGPHVSPNYEETGIPFLSARHVRPSLVTWEDLKYLSEEDALQQWKKCKPELGDILYTKGGTTGYAAVVKTNVNFAIWVHIALLKPNRQKCNSVWLEHMLNSKYCYQQSQILTHGIANRDLGLKRMIRIDMYNPPLELQEQFSTRISKLEKLKASNIAALEKHNTLFASLQHQAFTGQL